MLRIYPIVLEVLKQLQPALRRIEVQDRDLARQLRRASSSVALNLGEGMYSRGQNRQARYHTALGSARDAIVFGGRCALQLRGRGQAAVGPAGPRRRHVGVAHQGVAVVQGPRHFAVPRPRACA